MSFCWSTLQWFSRDKITGYSDVWRNKGNNRSAKAKVHDVLIKCETKTQTHFEGVVFDGFDDVSEDNF